MIDACVSVLAIYINIYIEIFYSNKKNIKFKIDTNMVVVNCQVAHSTEHFENNEIMLVLAYIRRVFVRGIVENFNLNRELLEMRTNSLIEAVGVVGVASLGDPLVIGEVAVALGLEVEKTLAYSIPVAE